jgi:hypothetical protein
MSGSSNVKRNFPPSAIYIDVTGMLAPMGVSGAIIRIRSDTRG